MIARLVLPADLPKAVAALQGGTALASVMAAPLGSFLGGLVGWRGAFFVVVPIGIAGVVWQWVSLPTLPPTNAVTTRSMFGLMLRPFVATGMVATTLAFMGQFALSTYLRPYLEGVTGLDVNTLSLVLLGLGLAGLAGTAAASLLLRSYLNATLVSIPTIMAAIALLLIALGSVPIAVAALLFAWGFLANPIPVAWNTWMVRNIPNDLEAAGGMQVALIQLSITLGAYLGGVLFDTGGWQAPFFLGAVLLVGSAVLATITILLTPRARV